MITLLINEQRAGLHVHRRPTDGIFDDSCADRAHPHRSELVDDSGINLMVQNLQFAKALMLSIPGDL
jgi:hypothetical protein